MTIPCAPLESADGDAAACHIEPTRPQEKENAGQKSEPVSLEDWRTAIQVDSDGVFHTSTIASKALSNMAECLPVATAVMVNQEDERIEKPKKSADSTIRSGAPDSLTAKNPPIVNNTKQTTSANEPYCGGYTCVCPDTDCDAEECCNICANVLCGVLYCLAFGLG
ncbi:hypothetical protein ACA910_013986 [Epithemia clementina (nom. ined.)]